MRAAAQGSAPQTSEENASPAGPEKHMGPEFRPEEGAEGLAGSARLRCQTRGIVMTVGLRKWREGKVRPIPGNSPHDRLVSRVISSSLKESLRRSLPRHCFPQLNGTMLGAQHAFSKAWRNLSVRCGQPTTKPWGET